jgi:hypothetical protein
MIVLANTLAWTLILAAPCALVALVVGRVAEVLLVVVAYAGIGWVGAKMTPSRPRGADPVDAPHLTLCHPHGVICNGFFVMGLISARYDAARRLAFGPPHFLASNVTFVADLMCRLGSCRCSSPSRRSIVKLMRAGRDLYLYPGGLIEASRHDHRKDVVDVGSRGAIRLALEHGYAVRVAFAFGESKTAYSLQSFSSIRLWLAKRGIPAVVSLVCPWAAAPTIAFSPTIQIPCIHEPTDSDVEHWHARYVGALRTLHACHKAADEPALVVFGERQRTV